MHRFVGIKQPAEEAKDTPPRGNRWATSCARLLGRRVGAMAAFTAVLAVLVVPLHKLVEFSTYDFGAMKFDWATTPRDHLLPVDPAYSDFNVLLDGHAHTTVSDGRLSPEQLVEYSIAQGYNAIVVTDHNTVAGGLRAEKYAASKYPSRFVVIPGMEYSNCRIHMNFINLNTTVTVGNKAFPSDDDIRHAIARVHELGGLAIVNHIPWSNHTLDRMKAPRLINHPSLQSLVDWGVDGFEIANQATFDMPTYQYIVSQNAAVRTTVDPPARLILMTGSDVHTPGNAFAWTVLKAPSFTKEAIVQEIKHARTSFLFDPTGNSAARFPRYSARYLALAPLSELAQYFEGFVDRHQGQYSFHGTRCQRDVVDIHGTSIACFVAYFIAAAILFELLYRLLGCFWRRVVRLLRRTKNQQ
ncbi:hypothetical protein GGI04_000942 [Coemansia thaxteri]|uniref:Polymerase/histidinol phosphatase N-terminal domain-containing protein n=1 Tax=Coemansia thaxteri TaxID=2663907 RepID=A0A9W8BLU1_9FUNG|nr:hypothetical protein H4R26_001403 [Coemansia thaxteri]KAJ2008830.1 hypothetical protein GGI04_000942 [Coemansia thaxteri]KAJ2473100.1 hypothetical protein GGI02_001117 [Coemansia sp. RSA 2322]KAJ2487345.1 hypothetical protein EV174_000564 [Coemansia sp. RSA 2320]